jgi:hypothetical protein
MQELGAQVTSVVDRAGDRITLVSRIHYHQYQELKFKGLIPPNQTPSRIFRKSIID